MNCKRVYSPPREEGGRATIKWPRSEKARTGWSLAGHVSQCVLKHLRVSDHPVCGTSVASRLFIHAAATPPSRGGECANTEHLVIHSPLHRPPLQFKHEIYFRIRSNIDPGLD